MFTYQQIKAIQEHRFARGSDQHQSERGSRPQSGPLSGLLEALAGNLARLGAREGKGRTRPASPAY